MPLYGRRQQAFIEHVSWVVMVAAARVEEDFQIDEWGLVEGGHDIDAADIKVRLTAPRVMMNLLKL